MLVRKGSAVSSLWRNRQTKRYNQQETRTHTSRQEDPFQTQEEDQGGQCRELLLKKILEDLRDKEGVIDLKVKNEIIFYGEHGIGKTWIARELATRIAAEHPCMVVIWLYLNRNYNSYAHYKSIARQLFQQPDEWEDDYASESDLCELLKKELDGKKGLLVLDGLDYEDEKQSAKYIRDLLDKLTHPYNKQSHEKLYQQFPMVLITAKKETSLNIEGAKPNTMKIELKGLTEQESVFMLNEKLGKTTLAADQLNSIARTSKDLPIEVAFRATYLKYIIDKRLADDLKLDRILQETSKVKSCLLLKTVHETLHGSIMMKCLWLSKHYFEQLGSLHYNELICYWIMEGCFEISSVRSAYEEGHNVLLDLVGAGLLGYREAGEVVIERAGLDLSHYYHQNYDNLGLHYAKTDIGLPSISKGPCGLGKLNIVGRKIVGFKRRKGDLDLSVLLVDGTSYNQIDRKTIAKLAKTVQVFVLFDSTCESRFESLHNMEKLEMLVLRGCDSASRELISTAALNKLSALEILGGFSSVEKVPDKLFNENLQSLNLSGLQIKAFPSSSISALTKLRYLMLKNCTCLKIFPSLKCLNQIEVIDLAGCEMLEKFEDRTFYANPKLRVLDFSKTNIYEFPIIKELKEVTHLLLKDCPRLSKPRILTNLKKLQIIDYSGCKEIKTMAKDRLPKSEHLITLDLSGTMIQELNLDNVTTLHHLRLKGCNQLEKLSSLKKISQLQTLDVSGAAKLTQIKGSLQNLKLLQ